LSICSTPTVPEFASGTVRKASVRRQYECLLFAVLCASIGFIWQAATVYRNYHGNWTALFCVGALSNFPDLPGENVYRFANSQGFDGQFYYLVAHNPSPPGALAASIDSPDLRYERILVPLLAYAGALGNPKAIAFSFVAVNLFFLFLGSWWIGKTAAFHGMSPAWGLAFLLIPAVPISLDRMTVDLAFVALTAGGFYFYESNQPKKMFAVMVMLCLTRETGLLIVAAFVASFAIRGRWKPAVAALTAALPFGLWLTYVLALHPLQIRPWVPAHPFTWTWAFLVHPASNRFIPAIGFAVRVLDLAALAGLAAGFAVAVVEALRNTLNPARLSNLLFSGLGIYLLSLDEWTHVYDFGRVLSPLALSLLVSGVVSRRWWLFFPACSMTLRVAAQMAPQILSVVWPY
jgi:hypothetical protein